MTTEMNNYPSQAPQVTGNEVAVAVALGRIEEKVGRLDKMDDRLRAVEEKMDNRLRQVEDTVNKLVATQKPKTPWYSTVGAVVGIITGLVAIGALLSVLVQVSTALGH